MGTVLSFPGGHACASCDASAVSRGGFCWLVLELELSYWSRDLNELQCETPIVCAPEQFFFNKKSRAQFERISIIGP
jgi:hypothetical protein